jgi:hypothetical protein
MRTQSDKKSARHLLGGGWEEIPMMFVEELDSFLFPLDRITAVSSIPRNFAADFVSRGGEWFEPDVVQRGFPGSQEIGSARGIDAGGLLDGDFGHRRCLLSSFYWHGPVLSLKSI